MTARAAKPGTRLEGHSLLSAWDREKFKTPDAPAVKREGGGGLAQTRTEGRPQERKVASASLTNRASLAGPRASDVDLRACTTFFLQARYNPQRPDCVERRPG